MVTKAGGMFVAVVCFAGMLGCVSADVYRLKEQEAQSLQRTNQEMQERNRALIDERTELQTRSAELNKEKEGLQAQIEKQSAEIAYLQTRAAKLEKDGHGLREQIEKITAKLSDLSRENQRLAALTRPENLLRTLGERLADLQQQVEAISAENQKLKGRQVAVRSEEERTGGAGETVGPAGEKPQVVQVGSGQTVEDSKQPGLSGDANIPGPGL